jgi:hypothetical protein
MEISKIINIFVNSPSDGRRELIDALNSDHTFVLLAFAERMAALGVRERSRQRLFEGLIAIVIENFRYDTRENILILSLLNHSCVKIGVDPVELFREAASFADQEAADELNQFVKRPPESKGIKSMGYKEVMAQDGFRYQRTW